MKEDLILSEKIKRVVEIITPKPSQISFAIINLNTGKPEISGYNLDNFIYPASIYKVFVGAEMLRKVYIKELELSDIVEIKFPNDVDTNIKLFPTNTSGDNRPLLKSGNRVTIDYLLNLMFSRSDNTAANTLMDMAGRENINNHIILPNGWYGSEVTRKFLDRLKEEKEYRVSKITVSNARHLADCFYKIETDQFVNEWVSKKLRLYMENWNRGGRSGLYIPEFVNYYRKGGWLEVNGYKHNFFSAIKNILRKGYAINRWVGDAGVVKGKKSHYVIAILTLTKSVWPWVKFPMKEFSQQIHELMENQSDVLD